MTRTRRIIARQKADFLAAMARLGTISAASRETGISRSIHYEWMDRDPAYVAAFRDAEDAAVDAMEAEAWRRAVQGVNRPVYQGGKYVGDVTEYSDQVLITMLKAHRPEKYRERVDLTVDVRALAIAAAQREGLDPEVVMAQVEALLAVEGALGPGTDA